VILLAALAGFVAMLAMAYQAAACLAIAITQHAHNRRAA